MVIEEIQKAPDLLNEVHRFIESKRIRFLLTASSPRNLRPPRVHLLGGRAGTRHFHPLLRRELGDKFDFRRVLRYGTLPSAYFSDEPESVLKSYLGTYLAEEIAAEGLVRDLSNFARFLELAAHYNGSTVNHASLASDALVPRTTVHDYFRILRDTLFAYELPAWRRSHKRKAIASSKWYFFDIGVAATLQSQSANILAGQNGYAFQTWLHHELRSWIDYCGRYDQLSHWKTHSGFEVDFLIGDHTAVGVAAKRTVRRRDLRSLRALKEEKAFSKYLCVSLIDRPLWIDGIEIISYPMFLDNLWDGAYG